MSTWFVTKVVASLMNASQPASGEKEGSVELPLGVVVDFAVGCGWVTGARGRVGGCWAKDSGTWLAETSREARSQWEGFMRLEARKVRW